MPKINKNTSQILQNKILKEKKRNMEKMPEALKQNDYCLNNNSFMNFEKENMSKKHFLEAPYQQRIQHYMDLKTKKIDLAKKEKNYCENYDINTGNPLFKVNIVLLMILAQFNIRADI